jgi:hypothetical protein
MVIEQVLSKLETAAAFRASYKPYHPPLIWIAYLLGLVNWMDSYRWVLLLDTPHRRKGTWALLFLLIPGLGGWVSRREPQHARQRIPFGPPKPKQNVHIGILTEGG